MLYFIGRLPYYILSQSDVIKMCKLTQLCDSDRTHDVYGLSNITFELFTIASVRLISSLLETHYRRTLTNENILHKQY